MSEIHELKNLDIPCHPWLNVDCPATNTVLSWWTNTYTQTHTHSHTHTHTHTDTQNNPHACLPRVNSQGVATFLDLYVFSKEGERASYTCLGFHLGEGHLLLPMRLATMVYTALGSF